MKNYSIYLPVKLVEFIDHLVLNEGVDASRNSLIKDSIIKNLREIVLLNGLINNVLEGKELKEFDLMLKTINFNYTNTLNIEVIMYLFRYMKLNKKPTGVLKKFSFEFMNDILTVATVNNFGKHIGQCKVTNVEKTNHYFEFEATISADKRKRKVRVTRSNAKYILDENMLQFTVFDLYFNKYDKLYYLKPKGEKIYCQQLIKA